ncbi:hypothetical protein OROGR_015476 [Orobanche gracilis]
MLVLNIAVNSKLKRLLGVRERDINGGLYDFNAQSKVDIHSSGSCNKEKYRDANKRAKQALEKYGATRMEIDIDGSCTYVEPQCDAKNSSDKHSRPKALKTEEELLRAFYEFKIQDVCDAFRFPRKIQATALIYFKRFYLQWLTCIYAACKAEENYVSAEEPGKGIEQDHQMILNNEMLVLQIC